MKSVIGFAFLIAVALSASPARAADYALILSDAERAALIEALDEATKAKGLQIAPNTVYLANKIRSAPLVTERKDDPPPAPKEPAQ
jgi:hypothetical protein